MKRLNERPFASELCSLTKPVAERKPENSVLEPRTVYRSRRGHANREIVAKRVKVRDRREIYENKALNCYKHHSSFFLECKTDNQIISLQSST